MTSQLSVAANQGSINWADLNWERTYDGTRAYSQSKIALGLFGLELDRRSRAGGWGERRRFGCDERRMGFGHRGCGHGVDDRLVQRRRFQQLVVEIAGRGEMADVSRLEQPVGHDGFSAPLTDAAAEGETAANGRRPDAAAMLCSRHGQHGVPIGALRCLPCRENGARQSVLRWSRCCAARPR
ncbi:hypothetical protein [Amycolatopsis thermoflava]